MDFDAILAQILHLLQQEKRLSYRALKRRFALDDEYLEDVKAELIQAKQVARDEAGAVLVWVGEAATPTIPASPPTQPGLLLAPRLCPFLQPHLSPRLRRLLTPSGASSRCCSAISWTRLPSLDSSIRKTSGRWCAPISSSVLRSSSAL